MSFRAKPDSLSFILSRYTSLLFVTVLFPVERMEKEAEEERMRKQRAATERAFQDGITKARLVMRRTPLGTDRNHNRWVLHTNVERVYTDKCTFSE